MNDELKNEEIKSTIYEVRGTQVMLDSDLAGLYGYATKAFNQQANRNSDKFNDNHFKLTKEELDEVSNLRIANLNSKNETSRSQFVTAIMQTAGVKGGRTSLPYAFTLDGIKVLSTILRGPNVASITSSIIEAFDNINNNTKILEKSLSEAKNGNLVRFESGDILLDVNVSPDEITVWLTQNDLAKLYETTKQLISYHINNIFDSKELNKDSVVKISLTTEANEIII